MSERNDGGPAYPIPCQDDRDCGPRFENGYGGMSLRQYAAIRLRVPDSGTDWLDDMIKQSLRTDLAAKTLVALLIEPPWNEGAEAAVNAFSKHLECSAEERYARVAYIFADHVLAARERS